MPKHYKLHETTGDTSKTIEVTIPDDTDKYGYKLLGVGYRIGNEVVKYENPVRVIKPRNAALITTGDK